LLALAGPAGSGGWVAPMGARCVGTCPTSFVRLRCAGLGGTGRIGRLGRPTARARNDDGDGRSALWSEAMDGGLGQPLYETGQIGICRKTLFEQAPYEADVVL